MSNFNSHTTKNDVWKTLEKLRMHVYWEIKEYLENDSCIRIQMQFWKGFGLILQSSYLLTCLTYIICCIIISIVTKKNCCIFLIVGIFELRSVFVIMIGVYRNKWDKPLIRVTTDIFINASFLLRRIQDKNSVA